MTSVWFSLLLWSILTISFCLLVSKFFNEALTNSPILTAGLFMIALCNLSSLMLFSYPLTATLSFNLSVALVLWGATLSLSLVKVSCVSMLMPAGAPGYLMSFLSIVEAVSILVRPATLSFRLLANISAGHILMTLVCKLSAFMWLTGTLLCLLELLVCLVQGFVFIMLVGVYFEESLSH